jgi:hypothetical protein
MLPILLASSLVTTNVIADNLKEPNKLEKCVFIIQIHQPKTGQQWILCADAVYNLKKDK